MTPEHRGELWALWPEWKATEPQRAEAARRRRLYVGNYKTDVRQLVQSIGPADAESRDEISKFVDTSHGLFGAVANTCAVVYQRGVRRELRDAHEAANHAFSAIVTESGFAALGPALNALAWAIGPVVCVPHVIKVRSDLRLAVTPITADRYAVRRHASAPDVLEAVLYQRDDGVLVEVDADGWRYWTANGDRLDDGKHDAPHSLGYCPAAVMRARPWLTYDWRGTADHVGLTDATLKIAYLHALGQWVRTQTSAPLTTITSLSDKYAKQQSIAHPSRPLVFDAAPGEVRVDVQDRTTDPRLYLSEIQSVVNAAIVPYGIPPSAVTFTNDITNWGVLSLSATPVALAAQRDAQTPLLREGEIALWRIACDVVRESMHPLARDIPSANEVARTLRVAFPDLSAAAEQQARMAVFEMQLPHGLASAEEVLMRDRPELTRQEAREEIAANLTEYTTRIAELAARNTANDAQQSVDLAAASPSDPARGVESLAQRQGREGGKAKAARTNVASDESKDP